MATDRRQQIQLSPDEQAVFFRERKKAALATIDKDGFPHVVAMNYFAREGEKVVNIRRNPKVALMIEAGDEYAGLRGVMIRRHLRHPRGRNQRQGGVRVAGRGASECVAGPAGSAGQRAEARGAQDRSGEGGQLGPPQARRTILTADGGRAKRTGGVGVRREGVGPLGQQTATGSARPMVLGLNFPALLNRLVRRTFLASAVSLDMT